MENRHLPRFRAQPSPPTCVSFTVWSGWCELDLLIFTRCRFKFCISLLAWLWSGPRLGVGGVVATISLSLSLWCQRLTLPLLSAPARLSLLNIFNPSFVRTFTSHCDHRGLLGAPDHGDHTNPLRCVRQKSRGRRGRGEGGSESFLVTERVFSEKYDTVTSLYALTI